MRRKKVDSTSFTIGNCFSVSSCSSEKGDAVSVAEFVKLGFTGLSTFKSLIKKGGLS